MSASEIRKLRARLSLTQEGLAQALGVANGLMVYRWETGKRNPGEPIIRLVKLLNDLPKEKALKMLKQLADYK